MILPPSAKERHAASVAAEPADGSKITSFYNEKLPFSNLTLNRMLTRWILESALPWSRIEDPLLRIAFRYARREAKIFGRHWVARKAKDLYLSLQDTSLNELAVCHHHIWFLTYFIAAQIDHTVPFPSPSPASSVSSTMAGPLQTMSMLS